MNTPRRRPDSSKIPSPSAQSLTGDDREAAPSFEQSLAELERIVQDLEHGDLGLAETLARYEQGVKHLKECYGQLEAAERRVELLKQIDARGQAVTEPFEEESMSLEEKAAARGTRRSASPRQQPRSDRSADGDAVDGSAGLF